MRVRKLIADATGKIVADVVRDALAGDVNARQLFITKLMPRHRFVATPLDLQPAKNAAEAREQIGTLVSLALKGDLDLDSAMVLSRALSSAIDARLAELEAIVEAHEAESDDV